MADLFQRLPQADQLTVLSVVAEVEQAANPVPADHVPTDATIRGAVEAVLDRRGRTLVTVGPAAEPVGLTTATSDDIADRLADAGIGVLPADQRAVLALVLLHCVAIPTTRGQHPEPWSSAPPVSRDELNKSPIPDRTVTDALRELHDAHIIVNGRAHGIRPGPGLDRLTPHQRERLERDLLAVAGRDDPVVRRLVDRIDKERAQDGN